MLHNLVNDNIEKCRGGGGGWRKVVEVLSY